MRTILCLPQTRSMRYTWMKIFWASINRFTFSNVFLMIWLLRNNMVMMWLLSHMMDYYLSLQYDILGWWYLHWLHTKTYMLICKKLLIWYVLNLTSDGTIYATRQRYMWYWYLEFLNDHWYQVNKETIEWDHVEWWFFGGS